MLVRRAVRWPLMKLSVGLVMSVSGSVVWAGSGVACGQRGRVICCACAMGTRAGVKSTAEKSTSETKPRA